jgi:hypothetical protein
MGSRMLNVTTNVVGTYSDIDESLAEAFKLEFEDINHCLQMAGHHAEHEEPDCVVAWTSTDEQRQYNETISLHCLTRLRAAFSAMKQVCSCFA